MPIVRREQLKDGMILAEDVRDQSGRILLSAGAEIAEKHIRVFQSWGVTEFYIEGEAAEAPVPSASDEGIDPKRMEQARAEAERLFCRSDLHAPVMRELFNIVVDRLAVAESRRT
jgi:hypothetical protein